MHMRNGYMPLSSTENSNSVMTNKNGSGTNQFNNSQTTGELSSILPPRHGNSRGNPTKVSTTAPLRDRSGQNSRINIANEHQSSVDERSRMMSKEVISSSTAFAELQAIEEATKLQSSFARRQQHDQNNSALLANHTTFNPFRSRSTPPLPQ